MAIPIRRAQQMEIEAVRHLQYWVFPYGGNSSVSLLKPVFQQALVSADNGTAHGQLAMYCMCDFEDRDKHLVSLVQLAIDAYAVAEGSRGLGAPFAGGAGYFASPLWPIRAGRTAVRRRGHEERPRHSER